MAKQPRDARLVPTRRLDPRPAADARAAPIAGAVNVPLDQLPQRTHELPPRDCEIAVVGPPALARRAVALLRDLGRRARVDAGDTRPPRTDDIDARRRLWTPTAFLEQCAAEMTPRRALDCACGAGRDAVYLADAGWSVVGVDVLPDALARAGDLARRYLTNPARVEWRRLDLETLKDDAFEGDAFDLITTFRYLHRPLFERIRRWLRPGGSLLVETFTTEHRRRHGKPNRDAFVLRPGELRELLAGLELRHYSEDWRGEAHTARAWATKP
ncbi:MAG: methyltransferase domain-containing protein [Planctomycetota bacterium]|nr:MAG: methyltransferase domain-containing protein [Planctomycetota bacterium]